MNAKKILSVFLLLFGQALVIISFLYFGRNLPPKILTLNICVTTVIYLLYAVTLVRPSFGYTNKAQKFVGAIGIKGFFYMLYTIIAVGLMWELNSDYPADAGSQIIMQAVLFFILCLGIYLSMSAADKVEEVYIAETNNRAGLEAVKKTTRDLTSKLNRLQNVPQDIVARLTEFQENLRFISPSNAYEAAGLEKNFINKLSKLNDCLFESPLNHDKMIGIIQNCEAIYLDRKQVYTT